MSNDKTRRENVYLSCYLCRIPEHARPMIAWNNAQGGFLLIVISFIKRNVESVGIRTRPSFVIMEVKILNIQMFNYLFEPQSTRHKEQ